MLSLHRAAPPQPDAVPRPPCLAPPPTPRSHNHAEIEVGTSNSSAGGAHYGDPFADSPGGRPITEVRVRWGDLVYSIEVLYGNVSGGVHGVPPPEELAPDELEFRAQHGLLASTQPDTITAVLSLGPGERIVGASGRSGRALDRILFETNQGQKVGGGGRGGDGAWSVAPPAGSDGYLCKLSGLADEHQVGLLTFHWCSQGAAMGHVDDILCACGGGCGWKAQRCRPALCACPRTQYGADLHGWCKCQQLCHMQRCSTGFSSNCAMTC